MSSSDNPPSGKEDKKPTAPPKKARSSFAEFRKSLGGGKKKPESADSGEDEILVIEKSSSKQKLTDPSPIATPTGSKKEILEESKADPVKKEEKQAKGEPSKPEISIKPAIIDKTVKKDLTSSPPQSRLPTAAPKRKESKAEISEDEKEDREEKADFGETVAVKKESIAKQTEDERTKTIKTELKPKIEQPKLEKEAVNEAENLKAKSIPTADPARNDSKSKEKDAPKDQIGPAEVGSPKMKETEPRTKAPSILLTKSPEGNPEKDVGEGVKSVDQEKAKNPEKEPRKEKSEKEPIEVKEPEKPKNEGEDSSSTSKDKSGGGLLSWFGGKSKDKAKDKESEKETDKNKAKDKSEGEGKNKEEDISKSKLPDASPTTKEGGKVETPQTTKLDVSKKTEKEMGIAEKSPLPEPSTPTDSRSHLKSTTSSPRAEMEKINTPSPSEGKHVVGEDEKKSTTPPLSRPSETKGAETPLATSSPGDSGKRDSPRNIEAKSKDSPKTSNKEANVNDATSIPAANPEPIKKKGFIQNLFDNSSLFNVMSKRPVHPSKTKDPEKVQSAAATEKYRRTTAVDHATAIQAAWRGKKARKWLKIRHLASISIQRIYRGVLERKKTLPSLSIKREKIIIKQEQKQRMRDINRKEKDLKLLSQLPPDEYLQYENVRKQSAAKVIQTAWRQSNRNPLNYKFQERLSYSTKKKYPIKSAKFFPFRTSKDYPKGKFKRDEEDDGEEEMKGEEAKKSLEAMRLEKIVTASFRKKSGVAGGAEYLEQIYEPRNMIDYSMDENAISLSMLYQRIRAQASDRMTKKAEEKRRSGYSQANAGVIGGMRQRYGELLEAQQKADIILEEYLMDKTYLDYRKTERRKSLCTINELVDLIKHPLSLDEAADIINDSKGRLSMDEKRRNYAEGWLYDFDAEYVKANLTSSASVADSNKNPKKSNSPTKEKKEGMSIQTEFAQSFEEKRKAKIFDLAMESHLTGADTMVNSSRWDAVFVPAILTDHTIEDEIAMQLNAQALAGGEGKDTNKLTSSISMPKIKKLTKSESLKHLAKKWSTGEEVGDSLYWVTYATQPSKLLSEVNPDADITELIRKQASNENYQKILKEFHSSYFNPKQRLEKTFNTIEKENNRIQRLAKTIEKQTWKEIRLKFSDDFKELSAKEKAEKRMKSIIYVQSIMRGYLTRRRYQKLKQQQRFYHAVQHLLNEMELLQYEQNHPHHTPPTGNKTVPSLAANFLPRPSGGPKGALLSSVEVQQQQMISEIARITSSALKTPFQLPLPSNANSSSAKTRPATTTVLPPLADRGLNPPTMTQSIDYSSSNATTPLRHLMSKSATLGAVGTSSTSITPAKFDQVTKRTPYPENLNLPPHQIPASVTNTPHQQRLNEISQNYNQNDRVYSLRKVDEPVNVQLSARSGSIGGGGTGALGFETPLLQTPRGQFTVHKGETGGSGSKNNEIPPSLKLPRDTPRTQSQQITPRDAIMNPNPTAPSLTPMRPQNNPNDANQPPKSHRKQTPPTGNNPAAKQNTSNNSSEEISSSLNYTTTMTSTPLKQDQSTFLSPFLEMDGDEERRTGKAGDDDDGYISSPSQTSLSRSLSVSFGQVTNQPNSVSPRAELISSFANPSNKGSGKAVAFASSASSKKVNSIMKSRFPYIPDPLLGLLVNIERHYIQNQCNVNDIVDSALVADIDSFDKKAAIDFTVALLKKYPGKALITWLSEIPIEKAITANEGERSTKNIELTVEIVAITLAELSLYDPNTMKMASSISEKEIHNITQFTLLMRLFGAGTDSGNIRVLDLNTWFMELFILVISRENIQHRMDSSKLLAKLRCYLSKEAAKKGTTNFTVLQEYLDDIVPDYLHEGSDRGSVSGSGRKPKLHETEVSLDLIQELFSFLYQQYLAYYTNKGINPMTPAGLMTPSSAASPARHMVRTPERNVQQIQMLIQILSEYHYAHLTPPSSQSLAITTISLKEIQEILCALPTHRQLQRKIQTWFRAVPESFTTIINGLNINANSISQSMIHQEIFINILAQSLLPTNHSENRLFADILQRRTDNSNNQQTPNRKGANAASEMLVDIRLLNRVKNGEFLQAPL